MNLVFLPQQLDPYFNLAMEEYLFEQSSDDFLFLYRNNPSFIIGKHQISVAEANLPFLDKAGIPLLRRLSGGGAVFHDLGNINFCFITNSRSSNGVNFHYFAQKMIDALNSLGIYAYLNERNSLEINGLKISGNAEHIVRQRIIHHGTLLYDADLTTLQACINPNRESFTDRAIRSKVADVQNIINVSQLGTPDEFIYLLSKYFIAQGYAPWTLPDEDSNLVLKKISEKYNTLQWNYDYSPSYSLKRFFAIDHQKCQIELKVEKGHVCGFDFDSKSRVFQGIHLLGIRHHYSTFKGIASDHGWFSILPYFF